MLFSASYRSKNSSKRGAGRCDLWWNVDVVVDPLPSIFVVHLHAQKENLNESFWNDRLTMSPMASTMHGT
jgi:hypothetical protein